MSGQFSAENIGSGSQHAGAADAFAFDAETDAEITRVIAKYPPGKQASAVLPALYAVQRQMGGRPAAHGFPPRR